MLSILIPCLNEETLINKTFKEIFKSLKKLKIKKYEIIFIDDGSSDKSLNFARKIKKKNKKIIISINKKNFGLGYNFFKGIKLAKGNYFIFIPCDNSHPSNEISKILKYMNSKYDLTTTYYSNRSKQNFIRHLFTTFYTPLLNFIYGTNFPYFNGLTLYKTKYLKKIKFKNPSFSFQIEIFVYLFHKYNLKIKIVPTIIKDRVSGSKAFKFKNSASVLYNVVKILFKSIYYRISNFVNN